MIYILKFIKEDYRIFRLVHQGNVFLNLIYLPSFKIVLLFRLSQLFNTYKLFKPFAYFCTLLNDFLHGVWIGPGVQVGKGFYLGHPRGLVVNPNTIIGDYCSIIQQVTLGGPNTIIGNFVSINAGSKIISDPLKENVVEIGDNCIIAASATVLKSVPNNSVVAGTPAKVVKHLQEGETG
jgi:serine O-acetyltransferase